MVMYTLDQWTDVQSIFKYTVRRYQQSPQGPLHGPMQLSNCPFPRPVLNFRKVPVVGFQFPCPPSVYPKYTSLTSLWHVTDFLRYSRRWFFNNICISSRFQVGTLRVMLARERKKEEN